MPVLRLVGMEFFARVGHSPAERETGGRIQVDLEMEVPLPDRVIGRLKETVDYAAVHRTVAEAVTGREHVLLEDLAVRILDAVASVGATTMTVRVRKPHPPIEGVVEAAEYELVRTGLAGG